jgi:CDP-diacylglycerol---glycerol-3-phosphate 3-phosphatidyltransferase
LGGITREVPVALRSRFPSYVEAVTGPIGRGLGRTPLTPNRLTTLGLLLTTAAAVVVATGELVIGGWLLVAGGLMDTFDGAVARSTGRSTPFGGFYDSVSDRISDGVILGGIAFLVRDEPRLFLLALIALVAAEVTSYVRAKAESIDLDCSVGVMERAERAILLMAGLIFHRWLFEPVLWLLAVGGTVTVAQRIHHVWCQIDRDVPEELLALALTDRKWSRPFKAGARRFYGQRNFDEAVDRGVAAAGTRAVLAREADDARAARDGDEVRDGREARSTHDTREDRAAADGREGADGDDGHDHDHEPAAASGSARTDHLGGSTT